MLVHEMSVHSLEPFVGFLSILDELEFRIRVGGVLGESDEWLFVKTRVGRASMDWPFYLSNPISW